MALLHNLAVQAIFLCFLVLVVESDRAYGSSRGSISLARRSFRRRAPLPVGLCESAVSIHGYKCQEFNVRTDDGYVLSLQRISEGRDGGGGTNKPPVLLQHGLLVDGISWFLNSPDQSLGFILADSGFDVWVANTRGTRFSRVHATLDASHPAYWNWSWDELVQFDLPATFDFVYGQTGQKLHYVGHSMGTLVALASFSQGKLVDKLRSAALLSPVAYLSHMTTALGVLAAKSFVGEITTLMGIAEFNIKEEPVINFLQTLCSNPGIDCYDLITAITGKNCCLNASTVDVFLKNEPQSTATKNMVHLAQTVRDGVVAKYDYGNANFNVQHYGQPKPPIYNLANIPKNLPLFMSYGGQDSLADPRDVGLLMDSLKFHDGDKLTVQFVKDYAHADFIMGVSAKDVVYNAMIAFFRRQ
ncbi:AB-hydrolase lipase domain [Macleaya cordata]|uniref:Lipase n=1 Tax=Macleaya cordata TaxID=56857 RepID=A0A200QGF5_MACCD|nr:AB-hydrolase lipase domain [Macleaya cordata]